MAIIDARRVAPFALLLALSGTTQAAEPAPVMTKEQFQQRVASQMQAMAALFETRKSKLGFEETLSALGASIDRQGWEKGALHDVQTQLAKAGVPNSKPMKVQSACPKGFNDKLALAGQGKLPPHPCRFTVFMGEDGKTYVMRMNTAILAKNTQGDASALLQSLNGGEESILKGIVE